MKLTINAISDKGLVRKRNEDMILVGNKLLRDSTLSSIEEINSEQSIFLLAVADGMGGHNAGDFASNYLLTVLVESFSEVEPNLSDKELIDFIDNTVINIHNELNTKGNESNDLSGMGSTLNALLFYNNKIFNLNVGDSRLYRFRDGILKQMSKDHSLAEITGLDRNDSHVLLNSVGGGESVFVEVNDLTDLVLENDILMLCSDGLSDMISNTEIENILLSNPSTSALVNSAKAKGGHDNISVVLAMVR